MCVCIFQTKSGRPAARVLERFVEEPAGGAIQVPSHPPPMQPDIDAATTIPPADDASDANTQAAAVATPTRTPDHQNTPRLRSVRPGDGAVIATMNQLVGMVRSLQADNRQLRQLVQAVQANQRQTTEELAVVRKQLTTMSSSAI